MLVVAPAQAFELDALLPDNIPGYGNPFGVADLDRLRAVDDGAGFDFGGVTVNPALQLSGGYDSAPNGSAAGSALAGETPSVVVADDEIGLGGFAAGNFQQYPQNSRQDIAGGTAAVGERAVLPQEVITFGAAYLATQETGFALNTLAAQRPIAFAVADLRASDAITTGMLTVTPAVSVEDYRFDQVSSQDRIDTVEALTTAVAPGGPAQLVLLLHATQSRYRVTMFNADTDEALAGIEDDAAGLFTLRAVAGVARRQGRDTGQVVAPVLEAAADWRPGTLDKLRLAVAREIDDPDQVSLAPYTLTQARLSLVHEYLRNVTLRAAVDVQNASYLQSPLRETLVSTDMGLDWQLDTALAVTADYSFNDRQANFLRAANEHVVTLGLTWTP